MCKRQVPLTVPPLPPSPSPHFPPLRPPTSPLSVPPLHPPSPFPSLEHAEAPRSLPGSFGPLPAFRPPLRSSASFPPRRSPVPVPFCAPLPVSPVPSALVRNYAPQPPPFASSFRLLSGFSPLSHSTIAPDLFPPSPSPQPLASPLSHLPPSTPLFASPLAYFRPTPPRSLSRFPPFVSIVQPLSALGKALRVPSSYGWLGTRECNDGWTGVVCDADGKPISMCVSERQVFERGSAAGPGSAHQPRAPVSADSGAASGAHSGALGAACCLRSIKGGDLFGSLPEELSSLTRLIHLAIGSKPSFSQLTNIRGPLPAAYSALVALQYLDLGFNRLSGAIPDSWGALESLFYLYMPNNLLSQRIPTGVASLPHLDHV
ncbi:unnamed protein product [Closterium sp. Naga37s-1]|nr:unnamed protein product [Closterium sp. Naga37s-1]